MKTCCESDYVIKTRLKSFVLLFRSSGILPRLAVHKASHILLIANNGSRQCLVGAGRSLLILNDPNSFMGKLHVWLQFYSYTQAHIIVAVTLIYQQCNHQSVSTILKRQNNSTNLQSIAYLFCICKNEYTAWITKWSALTILILKLHQKFTQAQRFTGSTINYQCRMHN